MVAGGCWMLLLMDVATAAAEFAACCLSVDALGMVLLLLELLLLELLLLLAVLYAVVERC